MAFSQPKKVSMVVGGLLWHSICITAIEVELLPGIATFYDSCSMLLAVCLGLSMPLGVFFLTGYLPPLSFPTYPQSLIRTTPDIMVVPVK